MKNMIVSQKGLTMIGLIFIVAFIAVVTLFTLRAYPLYYEKLQVVSALKGVANQNGAEDLRESEVHKAFMKGIQITNIDRFNDNNIKEFLTLEKAEKRGEPNVMVLKYDATNKLVSDLFLLIRVDERMALGGMDTGEN